MGIGQLYATDEGVTAHFDTPEGRQEINAKYLLGCDGANSTTRNLANIENDDLDFNESWLVIDTIVKDEAACPIAICKSAIRSGLQLASLWAMGVIVGSLCCCRKIRPSICKSRKPLRPYGAVEGGWRGRD